MTSYQPGMTSRDMFQSIAFSRMQGNDGSDEALISVGLAAAATDTAVRVAKANNDTTERTLQAMQSYKDLGYDNTDPIVKAMIETDIAIKTVLGQLAQASVRTLNR